MSEESKPTESKTVEFNEEEVKQLLETTVTVKIALIRQVANLIDVCQKRGAFQSSELEGVGALFRVLTEAINEAGKKVKEAPATTPLETVKEEE